MNKGQSTVKYQQFLGFYLTPKIQVMLPTENLAKIFKLELSNIVPIPDMSEAVVGVCPWQGEVLWLIDISYLLGFKPVLIPENNQDKCYVLKVKNQEQTLGLLVYQVGQLVQCDVSQLQPVPLEKITPRLAPYYQTNWLHFQEKTLPILDIEAIQESIS